MNDISSILHYWTIVNKDDRCSQTPFKQRFLFPNSHLIPSQLPTGRPLPVGDQIHQHGSHNLTWSVSPANLNHPGHPVPVRMPPPSTSSHTQPSPRDPPQRLPSIWFSWSFLMLAEMETTALPVDVLINYLIDQ